MKFIKLTFLSDEIVYINPLQLGHFYETDKEDHMGRRIGGKKTRITVTTNNNGGMDVKETPEEVKQAV